MTPPAPAVALRTASAPTKTAAAKRALGQFFTPPALAEFIAAFFDRPRRDWRIIDAGAGGGALTAALVRHALKQKPLPTSIHVTVFEVDPAAVVLLRTTLDDCATLCAGQRVEFAFEVCEEDFIAHTTEAFEQGLFSSAPRTFNAAIVNPPYRKLATNSAEHRRLAAIGIDVSNLYSAFLALLSRLLEDDGDLGAIVPRSFCNGPYFRSFRRDFLSRMSFRQLHVFESRSAAFAEDAVLQENIVFRAVRSPIPPATVAISTSRGDLSDTVAVRNVAWKDIVYTDDLDSFIRLPSNDAQIEACASIRRLKGTLAELGMRVSTGKVVDFRAREHLRQEPDGTTIPLLYPCHFTDGMLNWPKLGGKKPNAIAVGPERTDLLVPSGIYVVVRRFSAKEERKRIVASLLDPARFPVPNSWIAIENHLNFFHIDGAGLDIDLARGLAAYLNWAVLDDYFRHFNGHTQVNATDLRSLPYPTVPTLTKIGQAMGKARPSQEQADTIVATFIEHDA